MIDELVADRLQIERDQKENKAIASILVAGSDDPIHFQGDFYVRQKSSSKGLNAMDKKDYIRRYFNLSSDELNKALKNSE
jgi:hypothetical protein